jgi:hypothetical protein
MPYTLIRSTLAFIGGAVMGAVFYHAALILWVFVQLPGAVAELIIALGLAAAACIVVVLLVYADNYCARKEKSHG